MWKKILICSFILIGGLGGSTGFAKGVPMALQQLEIISFRSTGMVDVKVGGSRELTVYHEVKERDVFVECFVPNFTFNEKAGALHQEGEGHIRLYVNDEHVDTLFEPAFLIKDLPAGEHEIKVVVVKNDYSPYELEEEFEITVE
ncbi:hypothetical protein JCM9140_26 [Halalkalibacter wakoensis JCM 9140]|uniref:Uncharacterized protein n=1 Tax=Halalkalibacter wakoensis JCM 9140 TaxID=1236970 RepID=W4PWQ0_9BACI|nr:hypothetical protein [Halalkalibacter wakoensis]GAE24120.1 hypothetical protein JCM9140_26 [Halalkalibacter wakoensis JCM 9140]